MTNEERKVIELALEALETDWGTVKAITAIKEVLAQPEQEPVAWKPIETAPKDAMVLVCLPRQMNLVVRAWYNSIHNFWQTDYEGEGGITRPIYFHEGDLWHPIPPLYTTPPQRKPLTDEQIAEMWLEILGSTPPSGIHEDGLQPWRFARAIEAAHGIKE